MTDVSALYGLRLRTPRLELRLGSHEELVELGQLAESGIHPPEEMPFAIAWTDRIGEPDFVGLERRVPRAAPGRLVAGQVAAQPPRLGERRARRDAGAARGVVRGAAGRQHGLLARSRAPGARSRDRDAGGAPRARFPRSRRHACGVVLARGKRGVEARLREARLRRARRTHAEPARRARPRSRRRCWSARRGAARSRSRSRISTPASRSSASLARRGTSRPTSRTRRATRPVARRRVTRRTTPPACGSPRRRAPARRAPAGRARWSRHPRRA